MKLNIVTGTYATNLHFIKNLLNIKNSLQLQKQCFRNIYFCGVTTCHTTVKLLSYWYPFLVIH